MKGKKHTPKPEPQLRELTWRVTLQETEWEIVLRRVDGALSSMTSLAAIWKKIQAGLLVASKYGVKEWARINTSKRAFKLDWSARRIHFKERKARK